MKNSIAENPYFVMEFLDTLNTELRTRSVIDYKKMKKANNNNVIIAFIIVILLFFPVQDVFYDITLLTQYVTMFVVFIIPRDKLKFSSFYVDINLK